MIRRMQAPTASTAPTDAQPMGAIGPAESAGSVAEPIRVLIVDADRRVRGALSSLIDPAPGLALVGSVGHVAAAVDALETSAPNVVVLDPKLPDVDAGRGLIRLVRGRWPAIGIVVLTWADPLDPADREAPADRYLAKTTAPTELIATLQSFASGGPHQPGPPPPGVQ